MRKTKKTLAILALVAMVFSLIPLQAFGATAATASNRLAGADRIATANAVADAGWTSASTAILAPANDENLVDALAAAPLAGQANAPILLTDKASLDPSTKAELTKLGVTKVYAVGAIQQAVIDSLKAMSGMTVTQLQGPDRNATAGLIAGQLTNVAGSFVVGYGALADALSAASYAAANNYAIVVAGPSGNIPASETLKGSTTYVLGGPSLVNDIAGATRIYGADRFSTNQKVLAALTYQYSKVYVANGQNGHLVDSLVASSLAAKDDAAIVLCDTTGAAAASDISAKMAPGSQTIALGGSTVVPDAVVGTIGYVAPGALTVQSATVLNAAQIKVVFSGPVDTDSVNAAGNITLDNNDVFVRDGASTLTYNLSSDKKTLTLTIPEGSIPANSSSHTLNISNIKADGNTNVSVQNYVASLSFYDNTAPSISSVSCTSGGVAANTVKVTFSEPINRTTAPQFQVDGNAIDPSNVSWNTAGTKATLVVNSGDELALNTSHTVTAIGVTDFASSPNNANVLSSSFNVTIDNTAPTVALSASSDNKIKLVFSKGMKASSVTGALLTIYDDAGHQIYDQKAVISEDSFDPNTTNFSVTLPNTIYADKDTHTFTVIFPDTINDSTGNSLAAQTQVITMSKASTSPTITGISYDTDSASGNPKDVVLKVSTGLLGGQNPDLTKIRVIDGNGADVTGTPGAGGFFLSADAIGGGDTSVTINLTDIKSLSGTYTFYIQSDLLTDNTTAANTTSSTVLTLNFNGSGNSFKIDQNSFSNGQLNPDSTETFAVDFTVPVKGGSVAGSATNPANYSLNGATLPTGTYIYLVGNVANIIVPKGTIAKDSDFGTLSVQNVQNTNNIVMDPFTGVVKVFGNSNPILQSAKVVDGHTVILTFNADMNQGIAAGTSVANELTIKSGSTTYTGSVTAATVAGYKNQITLTIGNPADDTTALNLTQSITIETNSGATVLTDNTSSHNAVAKDITVTATR